MKKNFLRCIFVLVAFFLFSECQMAHAEVTLPLYTVDAKPQVILGDTIDVGTYFGLENYIADYVGDFLHLSYTVTHGNGAYASYGPSLYVTLGDPTVIEYPTRLYKGLEQRINSNSGNPTDVYFVDIQFSDTGYREIMTRGPDHIPFSDDTVVISGMDATTFVALANDYIMNSPPNAASMSFQPMRLTSSPPTHLVLLSVSTSTEVAQINLFVSSRDLGSSLHFTVAPLGGSTVYTVDSILNTSGTVSFSLSFPPLATTTTASDNLYVFSASIIKLGSTLESTSTTVSLTSARGDYPGYTQSDDSWAEYIPSSTDIFIQTLGTGFSGTLSQIDLETRNPNIAYYGSSTWLTFWQCDEDPGDGRAIFDNHCTLLYTGLSDVPSGLATTTQHFFIPPTVLEPSKYYAFVTNGNNQYNSLPVYVGSHSDSVEGACYARKPSGYFPCGDMSDLFFYMYGVTKAGTGVGDNVLFLPGIEASRLYRPLRPDEGTGEKRLWEPTSDQDMRDMFLDSDGKPVGNFLGVDAHVYTRDVIDEVYLENLGPNIYKSFLAKLEQMKADGQIGDYSAVPYDWRLSLDNVLAGGVVTGSGSSRQISYVSTSSDPYIIHELRRLVGTSKTGKVTIVAHSNGGLLTKALLVRLAHTEPALLARVDRVIFVAVPQTGSVSAVGAFLHGIELSLPMDDLPLLTSQHASREFVNTMSSAYNLLPSHSYFGSVTTPMVTFDMTLPDWVAKYGSSIDSETGLHTFLTDTFGRVPAGDTDTRKPDSVSDSLLSASEVVHAVLDNWSPPTGMSVVQVAGWGVPSTMSGIAYTDTRCVWIHCGAFLSRGITPEPTWTIDGDGTVAVPSALWMNDVGTERYWVDLKSYNKFLNEVLGFRLTTKHKDILEISELLTFIEKVLTKKNLDVLPKYISTTSPTASPTDTRLVYSLRSSLSLNIYDSLGNHTGVSTTTGQSEHNIPGSYSVTIGGTQYIFTTDHGTHRVVVTDNPKDQNQHPTPQSPEYVGGFGGGGGSSFTLKVSSYGGDTLLATTTFLEIPATSSTTASIIFTGDYVSTTTPLVVDTDGDGTRDIILNSVPDGIVTFTPPIPPATATSTATTTPPASEHSDTSPVEESSTTPLVVIVATVSSVANGPIVFSFIPHTEPQHGALDTVPESPAMLAGDIYVQSSTGTAPIGHVSVNLDTNTQDILSSSTSTTTKGQSLTASVLLSGFHIPWWLVIILIVLVILYVLKFVIKN